MSPDLSTVGSPLSVPAPVRVEVAPDHPRLAHLTYLSRPDWPHPARGQWCLVPIGGQLVAGIVLAVDTSPQDPDGLTHEGVLREIHSVLHELPPLEESQIAFGEFCAGYYHRPLGQVLASMLPVWLRDPAQWQVGARGTRPFDRLEREIAKPVVSHDATRLAEARPPLTAEQATALARLQALQASPAPQPQLLWGVTGSGKTRVFLEWLESCLDADPEAQALVLVPEIGLTPQLLDRIRAFRPDWRVAVMHSGMAERRRAASWLEAARGSARIVLGTRLAALIPLRRCTAILIDEEHDQSYKQQEGLRYHARDVLHVRAHRLGAPLVLSTATPSLESWRLVRQGRMGLIRLAHRPHDLTQPRVDLLSPIGQNLIAGLVPEARIALQAHLAQGDQVLVFLNRRGWAPVLSCAACGWRQECPDCHLPLVLHRRLKGRWSAVCHHCAKTSRIPRACPGCGHQSLEPIGRGLQQVESDLQALHPEVSAERIDRDSMRTFRSLEEALARVQRGDTQLVFATQMVTKGHDFPGLGLVLVLDADAQLSNPDFRAQEHLYAQLLQVCGRAGRSRRSEGGPSRLPARVIIQTREPGHPLFRALLRGDQDRQGEELDRLLAERQAAALPPAAHMASLQMTDLNEERLWTRAEALAQLLQQEADSADVTVGSPIAGYPAVVAKKYRVNLLIESTRRRALHRLLERVPACAESVGLDVRLDVDPLGIS